jgi:hypothetical protein
MSSISVHYTTSVNDLTADQLRGFFAGWPNPPSPETHLALLRASSVVAVARGTSLVLQLWAYQPGALPHLSIFSCLVRAQQRARTAITVRASKQ